MKENRDIMSLMTDELNSQIRNDRETYGYNIDQLSFKSDFPMFDYLNGSIETGPNNTSRMNLGIDQGKSIMIVGKAGSGKSTFGIQLAYSVMKKYDWNGRKHGNDYLIVWKAKHKQIEIVNLKMNKP